MDELSHVFVAQAIEESFRPGLSDLGSQLGVLDCMLNLSDNFLLIDVVCVEEAVTVEPEVVPVKNTRIHFVFTNSQDKLFIIKCMCGTVCKFAKAYEVFAVDAQVILLGESECAHIENKTRGADFTTKTRLLCINRM